MTLGAICAVLGLGCLAGAGFALMGGEDVGIERIFGMIVWTVIGLSLLGAAQALARTAMHAGKKLPADAPGGEQSHAA
jgi:hypothetical protein